MKLYDVPRNSKIVVMGNIKTPPASIPIQKGDVLQFHHIDGMYSYCKNENGDVVHLLASAEVEIIDLDPDYKVWGRVEE